MSETMKAAVLRRPRELTVERVPMPVAGPGQQLMQVAACGICGSDLRYFEGDNPWAVHTLGYAKPNPPNMILGHEVSGWVETESGRQAVVCLAFRACGTCVQCHRGDVHLCAHTAHLGHGAGWDGQNPGGMAEWVSMWAEHLYPLPAIISMAQATFLDGLGVSVHAVRRAAPFPGSDVLVMGAGPIGLMVAQVARALGAGRVTVTDVYETPLQCARELGLAAVNLADEGAAALPHVLASDGTDVRAVFDTTGDRSAQEIGLGTLGPGGVCMLMAGVADGLQVTTRVLAGERVITTSSNHRYEDFEAAIRLMASGQVIVEPMITHHFSLDRAAEAFEVAMRKTETSALKVIIEP